MKFTKFLLSSIFLGLAFSVASCSSTNSNYSTSDINQIDDTVGGGFLKRLSKNSDLKGLDVSKTFFQAYEKSGEKPIHRLRFATAIKMTSDVKTVSMSIKVDDKTSYKSVDTVYQGLEVGEKVYYYNPSDTSKLSETLIDPNYYFAVYQIDIINDLNYLDKIYNCSTSVNNKKYNQYVETSYNDAINPVCVESVYNGGVLVGTKIHKEHIFDAGVVTKEPTCTEEGIKTYTCTRCDTTKTEPISATGHTFTYNDATDRIGRKVGTCGCGEVSSEYRAGSDVTVWTKYPQYIGVKEEDCDSHEDYLEKVRLLNQYINSLSSLSDGVNSDGTVRYTANIGTDTSTWKDWNFTLPRMDVKTAGSISLVFTSCLVKDFPITIKLNNEVVVSPEDAINSTGIVMKFTYVNDSQMTVDVQTTSTGTIKTITIADSEMIAGDESIPLTLSGGAWRWTGLKKALINHEHNYELTYSSVIGTKTSVCSDCGWNEKGIMTKEDVDEIIFNIKPLESDYPFGFGYDARKPSWAASLYGENDYGFTWSSGANNTRTGMNLPYVNYKLFDNVIFNWKVNSTNNKQIGLYINEPGDLLEKAARGDNFSGSIAVVYNKTTSQLEVSCAYNGVSSPKTVYISNDAIASGTARLALCMESTATQNYFAINNILINHNEHHFGTVGEDVTDRNGRKIVYCEICGCSGYAPGNDITAFSAANKYDSNHDYITDDRTSWKSGITEGNLVYAVGNDTSHNIVKLPKVDFKTAKTTVMKFYTNYPGAAGSKRPKIVYNDSVLLGTDEYGTNPDLYLCFEYNSENNTLSVTSSTSTGFVIGTAIITDSDVINGDSNFVMSVEDRVQNYLCLALGEMKFGHTHSFVETKGAVMGYKINKCSTCGCVELSNEIMNGNFTFTSKDDYGSNASHYRNSDNDGEAYTAGAISFTMNGAARLPRINYSLYSKVVLNCGVDSWGSIPYSIGVNSEGDLTNGDCLAKYLTIEITHSGNMLTISYSDVKGNKAEQTLNDASIVSGMKALSLITTSQNPQNPRALHLNSVDLTI